MIIYEGLRTNEGNYKYVIISLILHLIILPCASNCEGIILIITCLIDLLYLYYVFIIINMSSVFAFFSGHLGTAARGRAPRCQKGAAEEPLRGCLNSKP